MTMRFKSPDESDHVCQIRSLVASPVQWATEHWPKENRQLETLVIHLPASLRSTGITPLHRYYERSDS